MKIDISAGTSALAQVLNGQKTPSETEEAELRAQIPSATERPDDTETPAYRFEG